MGRFQPVLPLLKTNLTRRRGRTWQILGLIVLLFLSLTFVAVRYLPTVVIDPVSVLANRDFKDIFAPPIARPPINLPHQDHDHALHLVGDQSRFKDKIHRDKEPYINLDDKNLNRPVSEKSKLDNLTSFEHGLPVENLTNIFSHMSIDELQKIQSVSMRREKVREVSLV